MGKTRAASPGAQAKNAARVQVEKCMKDDLRRCIHILNNVPRVRGVCKAYLESLDIEEELQQ
eukprot:629296-Amphidinium_carterae.1